LRSRNGPCGLFDIGYKGGKVYSMGFDSGSGRLVGSKKGGDERVGIDCKHARISESDEGSEFNKLKFRLMVIGKVFAGAYLSNNTVYRRSAVLEYRFSSF
jgi:hypothetical protein